MPSWKKVILSGSDAALNTLSVSNSITASVISASQFTGSLFGTSSWANNAITASYALTTNPILGAANSIVYFKDTNVPTGSTYVKTYYDGGTPLSNWSFRIGRMDPTTSNTSGSHILKDGVELFTNAKAVIEEESFVFLGFGKKNSLTLTESAVYEHPGVENYGDLIGGQVYAGSLKLQQNFYGVQQANQKINIYSDGYVVKPSSPGFLLGQGGFYIFESASMQFNTSGALVSPVESASIKFTLSSDSSSLSISVGKNDLREVLFISRSGDSPRIGIGKSTPNSSLDISGSIIITGNLTSSGDLNIKGFPSVSASLASLASGVGTLQQVTDAGNTTSNVISSSFNGVGFFGTASWAINVVNGGGGGGGGSDSAFLDQSTAATTWSFTHNLGTQYPVITVYDTSGQVIIPQEIDGEDTNNLKIYFPTSQSGYATAVGGTSALTYYSQSLTTASVNLNTITFTKGDSSTFNITVNTGSFTGSLLGTASWAINALTASLAPNYVLTSVTSSFVKNSQTSSMLAPYVLTSQTSSMSVLSSSYALTASYATNALSSSFASTASYTPNAIVNASNEFAELTFTKGDGSTIVLDAAPRRIVESVKNAESVTLLKGTPVYVSGSTGNASNVYIADAGNAAKMPAAYVLDEQLTAGQEGLALLTGFINGVDTSTFQAGQAVYVAVGGGYTNVKPTGSALIQKLGNVIKVDANGSGVITGAGRSNDIPNIAAGNVWVGNSDQVPVAVSTASLLVNTASFATTASFVKNAQTASYVLNAISSSFATTASHALNGGVTKIIAGTNVTISPTSGLGEVTINSSGGGGSTDTGSLLTTASVNLNTITFTKGDGSTFPITVNTGSGGGGTIGTLQQVTEQGASTTIPITASIISASGGITGSLFGTSSWANNAISTSYAATASYGPNIGNTDLILEAERRLNLAGNVLIFDHNGDNLLNTSFDSNGINITGSITAQNAYIYGNNNIYGRYSYSPGLISLFEPIDSGSNYVALQAPTSLTSSIIFTLPSSIGSGNNYVLRDDGTGTLYFTNTVPTASLATSASFALNTISSSFSSTASFTPNAIITASVSSNTITFTKGNGTTFPITVNTGSGGGGGVTINNNTDNYIVTATGTANTLNGESGLTYNGSTLTVSGTLSANSITITRPASGIGNYSKNAELSDSLWSDSATPALTSGSVVYWKYDITSGSIWQNATANTGSGIYKLGVVTKAESQDEIVLRGIVAVTTDIDALGGKPGDIVYLSPTSAGNVTVTIPTGSGEIVRILGYVYDPTRRTVIFEPTSTWVEL
jgi:hypothetical protein